MVVKVVLVAEIGCFGGVLYWVITNIVVLLNILIIFELDWRNESELGGCIKQNNLFFRNLRFADESTL